MLDQGDMGIELPAHVSLSGLCFDHLGYEYQVLPIRSLVAQAQPGPWHVVSRGLWLRSVLEDFFETVGTARLSNLVEAAGLATPMHRSHATVLVDELCDEWSHARVALYRRERAVHRSFLPHAYEAAEEDPTAQEEEEPPENKFKVRIPIDPADASSWDDRITLIDDGGAKQVRTVADDQLAGDAFLDLEYDVEEGKAYSLEIDLGAPHKAFFLFEETSYKDLMS